MSATFLIRTVIVLGLAAATLTAGRADELSETVRAAMARAAPSVVRIRTIGNPGSEELPVSSQVTTGLVISEQGEVLTSMFGFLSTPAAVFVDDADGQRVEAEIVARDHVRKLVLLKCRGGRFVAPQPAAAEWPSVGAWAIALGRLYPADQPTASVGIVSAVRRIHGLAIQTDAKISPVNYGGPLVNLQGQVMGILVPLSPEDSGDAIRAGVEWYDSGIGFAIPLADALKVAAVLRDGRDRVRGVLGIRPATRNPLAEEVRVESVFPESPAAEAGLQSGDRILEANTVAVTRFGIFDSIVRSSYAGDVLDLVIRRGDEELQRRVELVDKLKRPRRGYLGIIVDAVVGAAEEQTPGVRVLTLEGTPAAAAGLPAVAVLKTWDGASLTSADDLQERLRGLVAGGTVKLGYQVGALEDQQRAADESALSTAVVSVTERPDRILAASDSVVAVVAGEAQKRTWSRQETDLGEAGRAWLFAPEADPDQSSGLVLLLSASGIPEPVVLQRWQQHCQRHNLILLVPVNTAGTDLSREDASLVTAALFKSLVGRSVEVSRTALVADEAQAELCSDLLLNPRLRQLRAAVYLQSWPGVVGVPSEALAVKMPSVLLLRDSAMSLQARALQDQAIRQLTEAGSWVVQELQDDSGSPSPEQRVAMWLLNLKVR